MAITVRSLNEETAFRPGELDRRIHDVGQQPGQILFLVQRPGERPGTAVVLRGGQGVGKTIVGQIVGHLLDPAHYVLVTQQRHLTGTFNKHLMSRLLVQVEEAFWAGDRQTRGTLKVPVRWRLASTRSRR